MKDNNLHYQVKLHRIGHTSATQPSLLVMNAFIIVEVCCFKNIHFS